MRKAAVQIQSTPLISQLTNIKKWSKEVNQYSVAVSHMMNNILGDLPEDQDKTFQEESEPATSIQDKRQERKPISPEGNKAVSERATSQQKAGPTAVGASKKSATQAKEAPARDAPVPPQKVKSAGSKAQGRSAGTSAPVPDKNEAREQGRKDEGISDPSKRGGNGSKGAARGPGSKGKNKKEARNLGSKRGGSSSEDEGEDADSGSGDGKDADSGSGDGKDADSSSSDDEDSDSSGSSGSDDESSSGSASYDDESDSNADEDERRKTQGGKKPSLLKDTRSASPAELSAKKRRMTRQIYVGPPNGHSSNEHVGDASQDPSPENTQGFAETAASTEVQQRGPTQTFKRLREALPDDDNDEDEEPQGIAQAPSSKKSRPSSQQDSSSHAADAVNHMSDAQKMPFGRHQSIAEYAARELARRKI